MHRKHAPFAWCDCVKVYCAVNNQVETFIEQRRKLRNLVLEGANFSQGGCFDFFWEAMV